MTICQAAARIQQYFNLKLFTALLSNESEVLITLGRFQNMGDSILRLRLSKTRTILIRVSIIRK